MKLGCWQTNLLRLFIKFNNWLHQIQSLSPLDVMKLIIAKKNYIIMCNIGFLNKTLVKGLLKECMKMQGFDHPNVLKLTGVCMDGGPSPYLVMPFMLNGCLLTYLKKERGMLVISQDNIEEDTVCF